jgi:hypothetical protein
MDFLETVLTGMKEQEVREFRYFLNRHPQGANPEPGTVRRDLALVELIRKNGDTDKDLDLSSIIYGTKDRNAYHQLRNRLRKSLEEFLFFENSRRSSEYEIRKHIEIARYLIQKNAWEQALGNIEKAESLAQAENNYAELCALYNLLIQYSTRIPWISLNDLMEKRKVNQEKLDQKYHYLFVISQIRDMLETGEKLKSHIDIDYAVNRIMQQHHIEDENPEHALLWLDICTLVSEVLLRKNLLDILEQYLVLKHREFGEKPVYSSAGNGYRLRMLWQIIGLLFHRKKFDIIDKYLYELKYEVGKLRDIYPEMEDRLRCVEALTGLKTGQLARARQSLDGISTAQPSLKPWIFWIEAELSLAQNELISAQSWMEQIAIENLPIQADFFVFSFTAQSFWGKIGKEIPENWKNIRILEHFKILQQQENLKFLFDWFQNKNPQNDLHSLWLPEAGSLGFMAIPNQQELSVIRPI